MNGYERSKAPLALMEQIIMILVFALASAVCLQAFVYSNNLSRTDEQKQNAMTLAQQVTEYCKANQGDLDAVCGILQAERTEDGMKLDDAETGMTAYLTLTEQTRYLQKADVRVCTSEDEEVYTIEIAYQREGQE